jgi:hypothetical protein
VLGNLPDFAGDLLGFLTSRRFSAEIILLCVRW